MPDFVQPALGKLADALMAGGVVMGTRHAKNTVDRAALKTYSTSLLVNGTEVDAGSTSLCPGMLCYCCCSWLRGVCMHGFVCVLARFGWRQSV